VKARFQRVKRLNINRNRRDPSNPKGTDTSKAQGKMRREERHGPETGTGTEAQTETSRRQEADLDRFSTERTQDAHEMDVLNER